VIFKNNLPHNTFPGKPCRRTMGRIRERTKDANLRKQTIVNEANAIISNIKVPTSPFRTTFLKADFN
jgi:hypothetical protein